MIGNRDDETGWKNSLFPNRYFAFGIQLALTFAVYVFGGWWLDEKFGTMPLFLILGVIFAFISFFYLIWKIYRQK